MPSRTNCRSTYLPFRTRLSGCISYGCQEGIGVHSGGRPALPFVLSITRAHEKAFYHLRKRREFIHSELRHVNLAAGMGHYTSAVSKWLFTQSSTSSGL